MKYGDRIANLREKYKLTQQQLADKIGITRASLSHYEKNRREPDYETLQKLADFFDVSTDYLLGRTDEPQGKWRPASMDFTENEHRAEVFSNKLKGLLEKHSCDISQVADYCNVETEYLKDLIDNPSYNHSLEAIVLVDLANFFNVPEKYFYTDNDNTLNRSSNNNLPELTAKDEKDIAKKLESILESMDSDTGLAFDGEPMDEETRDLVRAAIESNLQLTKQLAKKKFTPKKYRK